MIKVIGEPGSGKTKKLMEYCQQENANFACKNPEAMRVKAHAYGFNINIISYYDYLNSTEYNKNNTYIDDIDEFLPLISCYCKGFGGNL